MHPHQAGSVNAPVKPQVFRVVGRLWGHLDPRRRRQLGLLGTLILLSGFSEAASLGALVPFLGVLMSPEQVSRYPGAASVMAAFGMTTADQLVLPFAALFAVVGLVAAALRLLLLWSSGRLTHGISGDLSIEIYRRTLYQPYPTHIARNSSVLLAGVAHKAYGATNLLTAQINLVTDVVILVAVVSALLAIHPVAAALAGVGFAGSYTLASWVTRRRLVHNGRLMAREQTHIIQVVQEGLGGIRDILLDWTQPVYVDVYGKSSARLRRAAGDNQFFVGAPRFVLEAVGIVSIVGLASWLSRTSGGISAALPVLGVLALAAARLLPVMQQAYASWSSMLQNVVQVSEVLDILDQPLPPEAHMPPPSPLRLQHEIRFQDVKFRYTHDGPWVLDGLNLSIPRGIRIGIVGGTGTGKSTLLDLLAGLLEPTEGSILVDGLPVTDVRLRAWQRSVAHVPQSIYLSDSTLAENIAFGIPPKAIDMERVRQAAAEAKIADFIEGRPESYSAMIGERGIRLSGGERQRVGIARALYKRGSVLVFDEATSALDNTTEQSVMDTIKNLKRDLTIIIIAHRVTTVRHCDRFIELISGRAVEYQSYEQMVERSPSARQMFIAS